MRRPIHVAKSLALVAVCLCVFVPTVSAQECLEEVGSLDGDFPAIAASGDHTYLAYGSVLLIVNVSEPSAPWVEGALWVGDWIRNISLSGGYAYVTYWYWDGGMSWASSISVVDVSTPSAPFAVSTIGGGGCGRGVTVGGSYVYATAAACGEGTPLWLLNVWDLSEPSDPVHLGRCFVAFGVPNAREVALSGEFAYVSDGSHGVRVCDVSDPSAPVEVFATGVPDSSEAVAVMDNYAYAVESPEGLWVLDLTIPTSPMDVGFLPTPGAASDVAVSNGYAYVADSGPTAYSFLRAIDVSTPSAPFEVGAAQFYGEVHQVAVSGGYVYVCGSGGMTIYRECAMFADGFESGDTSAWSTAVP